MRKINLSLQFLLPKKPFLQGHTSVNAANGTLMAIKKEVWSTLFSWVFRIFCSLEAEGCKHDQFTDHNNIKRNYYFILSNILVTCAMELLFLRYFGLTTKFFMKITVFTQPWQFSSIFFLMQVDNETQMFLFTKLFFNKQ